MEISRIYRELFNSYHVKFAHEKQLRTNSKLKHVNLNSYITVYVYIWNFTLKWEIHFKISRAHFNNGLATCNPGWLALTHSYTLYKYYVLLKGM